MVNEPLEMENLPHLDTSIRPTGYVGIKVNAISLFVNITELLPRIQQNM